MVSPPTYVDTNMMVAMGVLIAAYVLIFSELLHRTVAAIIGSVAMVGIGMWMGFYSQEEALLAIDGNTILLLMVMMMIVALLRPTGFFEYVGIRIAKLTGGNSKLLLVYFGLASV